MDFALRLGARHQQDLQAPVVHHAGQSVAGDEEQIADADVAVIDVRLDVGARADAARDDVAVGVVARLFRREEAGVDLLLDVRVVLRQLLQRAVAQEVDARIADLADQILRCRRSTAPTPSCPSPACRLR